MENQLSDEVLEIIEEIVGGKVHSLSYNTKTFKYNVEFEKDNRLQQKEVSKGLVEDVMAGRMSLNELKRVKEGL